jgi:predicted ATP-dependent serine protease
LPNRLVCFGEVGLSGEVRPVHDGLERLREAESHGYVHAIIPAANAPRKPGSGIKIHPVQTVEGTGLSFITGAMNGAQFPGRHRHVTPA